MIPFLMKGLSPKCDHDWVPVYGNDDGVISLYVKKFFGDFEYDLRMGVRAFEIHFPDSQAPMIRMLKNSKVYVCVKCDAIDNKMLDDITKARAQMSENLLAESEHRQKGMKANKIWRTFYENLKGPSSIS